MSFLKWIVLGFLAYGLFSGVYRFIISHAFIDTFSIIFVVGSVVGLVVFAWRMRGEVRGY